MAFDFTLDHDGELVLESSENDILKAEGNNLRLQTAYNRIKSVSTNWFVDEFGADLEQLIGRECTKEIAEHGKNLITNVLTKEDLWDKEDFYIKAEISNNVNIKYEVYFKIIENEDQDPYAYTIVIELDLIKGVYVRYGWRPANKVYITNLSRGRMLSISSLIKSLQNTIDKLYPKIKDFDIEPFLTYLDEIKEFANLKDRYLGRAWSEEMLADIVTRIRELNHDLSDAYAKFDTYVIEYKAVKRAEIIGYCKATAKMLEEFEELKDAIIDLTQDPDVFSNILKNRDDYYKIKTDFLSKRLSDITVEEFNEVGKRMNEIEGIFEKALQEAYAFDWPELEIWV